MKMRIAFNIGITVLLCKIFLSSGAQQTIPDNPDPNCFVATGGDCPNANVSFWLYTNATPAAPLKLDPLNLKASDFPERRPVKIIVHGYTGHRDSPPNSFIRPVLLHYEDVYVISPDYNRLVRAPCYSSAVQNLPLVSRCLAQLINNLVAHKIVPSEDFHIIGFSLGAQVAGQTANYLNNKLKRITGLDPSKRVAIISKNDLKLSKDDADFVDVIHTDVWGRGVMDPAGHIDFYPNFGSIQPGCETKEESSMCYHERAPLLYAESINPKNEFWSSRCKNKLYLILNICTIKSNDALMGYYVNESLRGLYVLKTSDLPPFALGRIKKEEISKIGRPQYF